MKKSLKVTLITLLPLVLFVNLLPSVRVVNVKLLLGIEFAVLALVPWKYRKELMEWSSTKFKEDREHWTKAHRLGLVVGTIGFLVLSVFFLVYYFLELLKE